MVDKMEINRVIHGDCIEVMKQMEDNSVDITITSPPYNLGSSYRGGKTVKMYDKFNDNKTMDSYEEFITDVITNLIRINKYYTFFNFQILSNNKIAYLNILHKFKKNIKDIIIWHKKQTEPSIAKTCLSSQFEVIIVLTKEEFAEKRSFEKANFNNREKGNQAYNVIYGDSASVKKYRADIDNKATFPEYFVEWFVEKFSVKNDLILDPFMGSGTTAVVCKKLERNFLGIELDKTYIDYTYKRLKTTQVKKEWW